MAEIREHAPARTDWIDIARVVCIWLIIMDNTGVRGNINKVFSLMAIPSLFFLSGYTGDNNKTLRETISSGVKRLLFPYILFQAIFYVYWFIMDFFLHRNIYNLQIHESGPVILTLLRPIIGTILCWGDYTSSYSLMPSFSLWWLPALFLVRVFSRLALIIKEKEKTFYTLCLMSSLLLAVVLKMFQSDSFRIPFCIDSSLLLFPFFEMGRAVKKTGFIRTGTRNTLGQIQILLSIGIIGMITLNLATGFIGDISFEQFNFGDNIILFFSLSLIGVITLISFSLLYTGQFPLIALLSDGIVIILAFHVILLPYINFLYAVTGLGKTLLATTVLAAFNISVFIIPINTIQKYCPILVGQV